MKRLLAAIVVGCVVGSIWAQSSFTIVRPADGSKVREKVRVMIPKASLEPGSYVGVFLNGKFVEAVIPPVEGNYRVYTLNTKLPRSTPPEWRNGIPDGELKLELVKYSAGDAPKIVDRSSVTVTVGNQMNITIPAGGIPLRYGFRAGEQMTYSVQETETVTTLSGVGNEVGGHAAQFPVGQNSYRLLYSIDNTYPGGDALLRMQVLPNRGKDYAILAVVGEPEPVQVFDYQMYPVYMRIRNTGKPVFGAVPEYFGFSSGGAPEASYTMVYGAFPLPVMPEGSRAPGSNWQTAYEWPLDVVQANIGNYNQVTTPVQARGEFVSAEWEMGHPCAKLRNSIIEGTTSKVSAQLEQQGRAFSNDKIALEEIVYLALDTHKIIKIIRSQTIDHKVNISTGGGGGGNGGPGGAAPSPGLNGGGRTGGQGSVGDLGVQKRPPGATGNGGPTPGTTGGQGTGAGGARQGAGTGGGGAKAQYIRMRLEQVLTLEQ